MKIIIAKDILKANDQIAEQNMSRLDSANVYCVNLLGSPGCGKTTLLEAVSGYFRGRLDLAVIEGDLATSRDGDRIEALGIPAIQINTGGGCHLDANMVESALDSLDLNAVELLFIENVGNLICPAGFKLGEHLRIAMLSVAEGDDKVAKYPTMFSAVDAVVINKVDLLPHVDFDLEKVEADLQILAPDVDMLTLSAKTGEGVADFASWLTAKRKKVFASPQLS
jgi:hydrogenase nickel incorporation protein HypB